MVAKRQPTAFDLRLVMGVSRSSPTWSGSATKPRKIAKGARRIHQRGQMPLPRAADVRHVSSVTVAMFRQALDAFARLDAEASHEVIRADEEVDIAFKAILRQLITFMMEDPRTISTAMDIIWIARAIERIGDHAKTSPSTSSRSSKGATSATRPRRRRRESDHTDRRGRTGDPGTPGGQPQTRRLSGGQGGQREAGDSAIRAACPTWSSSTGCCPANPA